MFEERLAKMEDPSQGDWDDGPVYQSISFNVFTLLIKWYTE